MAPPHSALGMEGGSWGNAGLEHAKCHVCCACCCRLMAAQHARMQDHRPVQTQREQRQKGVLAGSAPCACPPGTTLPPPPAAMCFAGSASQSGWGRSRSARCAARTSPPHRWCVCTMRTSERDHPRFGARAWLTEHTSWAEQRGYNHFACNWNQVASLFASLRIMLRQPYAETPASRSCQYLNCIARNSQILTPYCTMSG